MMAEIHSIEVKIRPKFTIDTDTAYKLLAFLEMYCDSSNQMISCFKTKSTTEEDADWHTRLEFTDDIDITQKKLNEMNLIKLDDVMSVFEMLIRENGNLYFADSEGLEIARQEFEQKVQMFGIEEGD